MPRLRAPRLVGQATLRRPCCLSPARGSPVFGWISAAPERIEGARDAPGPGGPTDPAASQRRGTLSPINRKSARPKASRARCLRLAPHRPRWTYRFRLRGAYPPLRTSAPCVLVRPSKPDAVGRPRDARQRAGTKRLGPPGGKLAPHLRRFLPATAPRPVPEDACADTPR